MALRFLLVGSLILALMSPYSWAVDRQTFPKRTATIPFNFLLAGTSLPAGTYLVEMMESGMLLLLNTKQKTVEGQAATLPLPPKETVAEDELSFVNSNGSYILVEIHMGESQRLLTSEYGRPRNGERQLRPVSISSAEDH